MKKIIFALCSYFLTNVLQAQDIILKTNGDELQVKVTEIGITEVKYNRFDNLTGPVYTLPKSEIFKITYEDGSQDVFGKSDSRAKTNAESNPQPVSRVNSTATSQSPVPAQASSEQYRRSSLYSLLIKHPDKEFANDIEEVFKSIPVPEKFNNHDLKFKSINAMPPRKDAPDNLQQLDNTQSFIATNAIARRLIAKWFDYDSQTGTFDNPSSV
jgi:hypothetical protein